MRVAGFVIAAFVAFTACDREPTRSRSTPVVATSPTLVDVAIPSVLSRDAATVATVDAGDPTGFTIHVINAGTEPLRILMNEDLNELLHTRKLWSGHTPPDGGFPTGELVKFFPVGEEPLCSADAGAGYGGLGQPEPRMLAPQGALTFRWDGTQRREVNDPRRGVCVVEMTPLPGRYRFEFDQPYNAPVCTRPVLVLPLAPGAPRTLEIRCTPGHRGEEHG